MTDVTMAPTQDAIADSLLGPQEQQTVEQPVAEQEVAQEAQPTVEQPQEQTENAEWLPTEQDKVFPDEVLSRYAQRYGVDEQWLSNPLNRQLLTDKINSDIWIQQQREAAQQPQEVEEPQEPTPQAQPLDRAQYFAQLDRMIQDRTDPEVAKSFHTDFLKSFGVPDAEIAKIPPQQAMQFTQTASKYMLNLVNTFMPDILGALLPQQVSQAFPGFSDMYERSSYAMAWDNVRNSDPAFANLPAYGTKDFSAKLRAASERIPGFDEMQFTDGRGQPLSMQENAMRKYAMLAQIAAGQNVDPNLVAQAAQAKAKADRRAENRRTNGNLGSGQSKASSGGAKTQSPFQTNQDIFDEEAVSMLNTRL